MTYRVTLTAVLLAVLLCACVSDNNNYLEPRDFVSRLNRDGIHTEGERPLNPGPFAATSGVAIKVAGSEIGVYKYDKMSAVQKRRLESIARQKKLHIIGIPYPVEVFGSFVVLGLDKNPRKRDIIKSLHNFK